MRIFFAMYLLFGLLYNIQAQIITIIDSETRKPIEMVSLISEIPKIEAITDSKGQSEIWQFKRSEKIKIIHLAYKQLEISFKLLEFLNFQIELSPKIHSLQEVSVSFNRWTQNKIETPSRVTSINMKEASFQNPQTTADLLGSSGYVFIQKSQLGGGSPMLRGMATNRVLLVVDGVRMNNAIFRSGNIQSVISIDANSLESSEIIFGPGSVMFGSDAIGGVMNFGTLSPRFSIDEKKVKVSGNAMTRFSSANFEKTGHFDFNVGLKNLAFLTSFTYSNYSDLRSGSNGGDPYFYRTNYVLTYGNKDYMVPNDDSTLQIGSKYSQINFMQKVCYQPNSFWKIDYSLNISETSKFNRYDRLYVIKEDGPYKEKPRWAEWFYGPQKWQMQRFGITNTKSNKMFDNLRFIAAYQFFEESRYDREFMYRELRMQKESVDAYSLNIDFEKKINDKISFNYGYEFVRNKIHSVANLTHVETEKVESTVTRYPDGSSWQSNGMYLTSKYKFNEKWLITGGVRYNHFLIKANFDTTFFPFPFTNTKMISGSTSGSLGCVFTPSEKWQIYLNASNGFRAPNVDDMGKVFESVPGYLIIPNPDLKPEKVFNLELGTVKSFGTFLKADATIYHTWLVDAMVRKNYLLNGDSTIRFLGNKSIIQAVQNVTKINVFGVQAGVEIFYKGFGLRSNISYQKGEEQTADSLVFYPLRHAAPTFGSTHLTYEYKNKFKAEFYVVYNEKMDYKDLALSERTNASYARDDEGRAFVLGWHTLNLKIAYFPSPFIAITAGIENMTDLLYRPYSSGINAPGRNLITSLKVKF